METLAVTPEAPPVLYADIQLGEGLRLRCLQQGPCEGDAVLLLHGLSD